MQTYQPALLARATLLVLLGKCDTAAADVRVLSQLLQ